MQRWRICRGLARLVGVSWLVVAAGQVCAGEVSDGQVQEVVELPNSRWKPGVLKRAPDGKLFLDHYGIPLESRPLLELDRPLAQDVSGIVSLIKEMAPQYELDPDLVLAVVAVESSFEFDAVSPRNAQGLMQLIPETARRFGVKDAFDVVDNLRGGMTYLRWLLHLFNGDVRLALAAYNAGEGAVYRYEGVPPFEETRHYLDKVMSIYRSDERPLQEEKALGQD